MTKRISQVLAAAGALAFGAMLRYPGGTALDPTTRGYSLSHNFLSDLGMTVAYNHEPNRLGAMLFMGGLLLLVAGLGTAVAMSARFLATESTSRSFAWIAMVAIVAACIAFAGVALTPENRAMSFHVSYTKWAWRIVPAAALMLGIAALRHSQMRQRVTVAWFAAALLLAAYAILMTWGPNTDEPTGLLVQVVAQKSATVVLVVPILMAVNEVDRARR